MGRFAIGRLSPSIPILTLAKTHHNRPLALNLREHLPIARGIFGRLNGLRLLSFNQLVPFFRLAFFRTLTESVIIANLFLIKTIANRTFDQMMGDAGNQILAVDCPCSIFAEMNPDLFTGDPGRLGEASC